MTFRFCDDLGRDGFGWMVEDAMTRTSHALAADGRIWLVDPVDWPDAIGRARTLGKPAGVIQLLDRHNRDCVMLAQRLGVPLLVVPDDLPGTPFECVPIMRRRFWHESALWHEETRTLVVADAVGTNPYYTGGKAPIGVSLPLRLTPPRRLGDFEPERVLVGHGEGIVGPTAADALRDALRTGLRRLPGVLVRLPFAGRYSGSQETSTT